MDYLLLIGVLTFFVIGSWILELGLRFEGALPLTLHFILNWRNVKIYWMVLWLRKTKWFFGKRWWCNVEVKIYKNYVMSFWLSLSKDPECPKFSRFIPHRMFHSSVHPQRIFSFRNYGQSFKLFILTSVTPAYPP